MCYLFLSRDTITNLITNFDHKFDHKVWSNWSHSVIKLITKCDQFDHTLWSSWSHSVIKEVITTWSQIIVVIANNCISHSHRFSQLNLTVVHGLPPGEGIMSSRSMPSIVWTKHLASQNGRQSRQDRPRQQELQRKNQLMHHGGPTNTAFTLQPTPYLHRPHRPLEPH